jgi:predicted DNA-binding protein
MARKKVSTTVYLEAEQEENLKLLSRRTKVPMAAYIREGIDMMLAKYAHEFADQLTLAAIFEKEAEEHGAWCTCRSCESG